MGNISSHKDIELKNQFDEFEQYPENPQGSWEKADEIRNEYYNRYGGVGKINEENRANAENFIIREITDEIFSNFLKQKGIETNSRDTRFANIEKRQIESELFSNDEWKNMIKEIQPKLEKEIRNYINRVYIDNNIISYKKLGEEEIKRLLEKCENSLSSFNKKINYASGNYHGEGVKVMDSLRDLKDSTLKNAYEYSRKELSEKHSENNSRIFKKSVENFELNTEYRHLFDHYQHVIKNSSLPKEKEAMLDDLVDNIYQQSYQNLDKFESIKLDNPEIALVVDKYLEWKKNIFQSIVEKSLGEGKSPEDIVQLLDKKVHEKYNLLHNLEINTEKNEIEVAIKPDLVVNQVEKKGIMNKFFGRLLKK
jgi:hypothetical protein